MPTTTKETGRPIATRKTTDSRNHTGTDPLIGWFNLANHVERALLLLSCPRHWRSEDVRNGYCRSKETFNFVRNVVATSAHFGTIPDEGPPIDTSAVVLPMDTLGFSGDLADSLVVPPQEPADSLHVPAGEGG